MLITVVNVEWTTKGFANATLMRSDMYFAGMCKVNIIEKLFYASPKYASFFFIYYFLCVLASISSCFCSAPTYSASMDKISDMFSFNMPLFIVHCPFLSTHFAKSCLSLDIPLSLCWGIAFLLIWLSKYSWNKLLMPLIIGWLPFALKGDICTKGVTVSCYYKESLFTDAGEFVHWCAIRWAKHVQLILQKYL